MWVVGPEGKSGWQPAYGDVESMLAETGFVDQELLGHSSPKTTQIYTHSRRDLGRTQSPVEGHRQKGEVGKVDSPMRYGCDSVGFAKQPWLLVIEPLRRLKLVR